ncbi:MAG TPA: protein translocase subunit SecD [Methylomirabilota bacterium]|jgi:preprotein translocase subunit SecD|nr:protein translocase subunit SecD [Methylomirabilota bacterium]
MRRRFWIRIGIVVAVIAVSAWYLYPPRKTINLGLDLQGGIHLVLGVEVDKALEAQVERAGDTLRADLEKKGIGVSRIERRGSTELVVQLASPQTWKDAQGVFGDMGIFEIRQSDEAAGRVVLGLRPKEAATLRDLAVRQGLETIRNRVDQFGVAEPSIQQQGENRILVQLPGVQDPERAKALIGKTALLEFKMLDERVQPEAALRGELPPGDEILYQRRVDKESGQERKTPYVVQKKALLTGRDLATARVSIDQNTSEPYVSVEFNAAGAKAFSDLTEASVGKRLAIVLDGNVHSAPVIRERIPSGRAQITGGFTTQEATDLAIVLRAGALPAPVTVLEERTVGPSLGADSIRKGLLSTLTAALAVVVFMLIYYRLSGLIADVALTLNLVILMAAMAGFHATLTLPGIAGIVLTIGMAVDTNILIFERIREELRGGKTVRAAIDAGFARAFRTVIDTHVTVLVSAAILYQFGTGPVKGFAVSLAIGILASLFTAVFFTRLVFDLIYMTSRRVESVSI